MENFMRQKNIKPKKKYDNRSNGNTPSSMPSEEEIQTICLQIQSEWTDDERKRRSIGFISNKTKGKSKLADVEDAMQWTPPICKGPTGQ